MDPSCTHSLSAIGLCAVLAWLPACASIPNGRSAVDQVTVRGESQLDEDDITDRIATTHSPKFMGLFRGVVYDYEIFDRLVLQRDLARVERLYRARGYYEAHARAGRVLQVSPNHVRVEIWVDEGEPVRIHEVRVEGIGSLPADVKTAVRRAVDASLKKNDPLDEDKLSKAEAGAQRALGDKAYAYSRVQRAAVVDIVQHSADVVLTVKPDRPAKFGHVTIEGLGTLPEAPVRRALDLSEGAAYSQTALVDAQQAVLDLGVFASVEIIPDLPDPPPLDHVVPLRVKVEPSKLHTVTFGGGVEFDALKTDLHVLAGWESRNFLGGMRTFSVNFKPGVVLYPTRVTKIVAPSKLLPEERLRLELRQPGLIEARTNGFIRPEVNIFPVLLKTTIDPKDPVVGYGEFKASTGLDRVYWKLFANLNYNFQAEQPFVYAGTLDPALRLLILSYPELLTNFDFRDDRVKPHKGAYIGNSLQFAGGPFGGNARDIKVQPEARGYVPITKHITWASRMTVGFLFPLNYGNDYRTHLTDSSSEDERRAIVRDLQIVFFRGFFSGGPSSNRGYPLRAISPAGVVPFLTPELAAAQIRNLCDPSSPQYDVARCAVPLGGFTLWEASTELRFPVSGPLSMATFCDASDVSPKRGNIRLRHLHLSCGLGARYDTPVGPIRLDVGYRVPGLQVPSGTDPREETDPGDFFGIPLALAFGIGEAF